MVHRGLDLADVSEVFDVGQFHAYANEVIEDMVSRGKKVLVVGGSGFFLQGFLQPVVDSLEVSDEVRNHVNTTYEKYGLDTTLAQLGKLNPKGLGNLDTRNPLRVIRALERCLQSERSPIDLQKDFENYRFHMPSLQREWYGWTGRMMRLWIESICERKV